MLQNFLTSKENPNTFVKSPEKSIEGRYAELPAGFYKPDTSGGLFSETQYLYKKTEFKDKLVNFTSGIVKDLETYISNFCTKEVQNKYHSMGINHKMGILLHGKPGTGKTSTVFLLGKKLVEEHNAIFLDFTSKKVSFIKESVKQLREIQNNIIIVFVDEIDSSIDYEETSWLTFLDGNESFSNLIVIGCTNYLDKIPDRIAKRPSRIKHLIEINAFDSEVYKQYIQTILPDIDKNELNKITYQCVEKGLTIDELKNVLINIYIENIPIERAFKLR